MNDDAYHARAMVSPTAANAMFRRRSSCGVRAESSHRPTADPAKRKPAHGKRVKVPRPGIGRMYHSIGSGSGDSHGDDRTMGVIIATTAVATTSHVTLSSRLRPTLHRTA